LTGFGGFAVHFATIDCGTTNSRVYVLDECLRVIAKGTKKVGVRDTAITGSRQVLREGLAEVLERAVRDAGLRVQDLTCAVTSGMITSEIGLLEIPHLVAPAGLADLGAGVMPVRDPMIFPLDVQLLFIRGIKNAYPAETALRDIRRVDFMRGEETQIMGLLVHPGLPAPPFTAVVLSSHTKYIPVNEDGRIAGSLTTLSGQLFEAIRHGTSIGKSIETPETETETPDLSVVDIAYDAVANAGFLRSLLMPRFMDVLLGIPAPLRRLFLDAAIAAEDLQVLRDFPLLGFALDTPFVLIGPPPRCAIFRHFLTKYRGVIREISEVSSTEDVDRLAILGAVAIAHRAGYLSGVAPFRKKGGAQAPPS
jgi:2-dehydro-3-deoxygalactonokinase